MVMEDMLQIREGEDTRQIIVKVAEETVIGYQREILRHGQAAFCLSSTEDGREAFYEISCTNALDRFGAERPSVEAILDLLEAVCRLEAASEEMFLDIERWCWNMACWTWNGATKELKGIYVPDHGYRMDRGAFLHHLIAQLMRYCLADHWTEERSILFLHRLYNRAEDLASGALPLPAFIEEEKKKAEPPKADPAPVEVYTPPREGFWRRFRKRFLRRRRVALPFS